MHLVALVYQIYHRPAAFCWDVRAAKNGVMLCSILVHHSRPHSSLVWSSVPEMESAACASHLQLLDLHAQALLVAILSVDGSLSVRLLETDVSHAAQECSDAVVDFEAWKADSRRTCLLDSPFFRA